MYETLTSTGQFSTQGIYFDQGSDVIKPESGPTLQQIAQLLSDHPNLKIIIEGHTDNQGDAEENQKLSEVRAAAVKQKVVDAFGADGSRIETVGFGSSKPAVPNKSATSMAQNRRVTLRERK